MVQITRSEIDIIVILRGQAESINYLLCYFSDHFQAIHQPSDLFHSNILAYPILLVKRMAADAKNTPEPKLGGVLVRPYSLIFTNWIRFD